MLTKLEKSKKTVPFILGIIVVIQVVLCCSLVRNLYTLLYSADKLSFWKYDVLQSAVIILGAFVSLFFMFGFVRSLKNGCSPFSVKNVKRLRTISVILISTEPIQYLVNVMLNNFRPADENGIKINYVTFYGGVIFVVGLIAFCTSLAFSQGVVLQNQSDETL